MLLNKKMVVPVRWLEDEEGTIWVDMWEIECDETTVSVFDPQKFPMVVVLKQIILEACNNQR